MSDAGAQGARIFLTDDHPGVLDGLAMLLSQAGHQVCGVAGTREEVRERLDGSGAELLLLDLSLCGESGLDIIPDLGGQGVPTLVYSMHENSATVRQAMGRGARGYVTKREPSGVLLEAIRRILAGELYISPRAAASLAADPAALQDFSRLLSEREQQILDLLAQGEANAEIALGLGVSVRTVETYCRRMFLKLGLDGMKALRKYALQKGKAL